MERQHQKDYILEPIAEEYLTSEQKEFQFSVYHFPDRLPIYKLQREPTYFDELDDWDRKFAIWRENGTLICIGNDAFMRYWGQNLSLRMYHVDKYKLLECTIYGMTDAAVAETATFFCSLKHRVVNDKSCLKLCTHGTDPWLHFDFEAFQPRQLARILESNPIRLLELETGVWSAAQSVILATRPCPLHLKLSTIANEPSLFAFEDHGTAFVNALETRETSFGSFSLALGFGQPEPFSPANLQRLLKLEIFDTLAPDMLEGECVLLPFSTKVSALDYPIYACCVRPEDFKELDIAAKALSLKIYLDNAENWDDLLVSFLDRVADLGHLKKLRFSLDFFDDDEGEIDFSDLAPVAKALVRVIQFSANLSCLDLTKTHRDLDWGPHLQDIIEALEEHKSMHTFIMTYYAPEKIFPNYSWLEKLLSRNRNIAVLDGSGSTITNGSSIDRIYAFNRFYHGSSKLVKESAAARPLLLSAALVESASVRFQRTALLLYDQTDVLCELVHGVSLVASIVPQSVPDVELLLGSNSTESSQSELSPTRKRSLEPLESPLAKKTVSTDMIVPTCKNVTA